VDVAVAAFFNGELYINKLGLPPPKKSGESCEGAKNKSKLFCTQKVHSTEKRR